MNINALDDLAQRYLKKPWDDLCAEEQSVLDHILGEKITTRDIADITEDQTRFGDRLADHVAQIGGSWGFIIAFALVLFAWMLLNSSIFAQLGIIFDPYPYIFLNLMLSTLAAIQAPIIMMSQNRQAAKDRLTASVDFETNLRTEIEILRLHSKIDTMMLEQMQRLERQQAQILARLEG